MMARSAFLAASARPGRVHGADALMHEGKLPDHRRRQNEGIEIRLAHAAVDRVDGEGERQPGVDDAVHLGDVRIEVDHRIEAGTLGHLRAQPQAECARGFERIDHVEIVRPGFRKILPGVRARIGGDEMLGPVGRGPAGIVALQRRLVIVAFVAEQLPELLEGGESATR